jgi:phosphatidylinositol glycan class B
VGALFKSLQLVSFPPIALNRSFEGLSIAALFNARRRRLTCRIMFYLAPRTLSGSLEVLLIPSEAEIVTQLGGTLLSEALGLNFPHPLPHTVALEALDARRFTKGLLVAALACAVRPTAVVYWLCIGLYFGAEAYVQSRNMVPWGLLRSATAVGLGAVAALFAGDALFYGRMTCPPYNFVKFNLLTVSPHYLCNFFPPYSRVS